MGFELTWESKGVVVRHFGVFTRFDLHQAARRIHADPRFDELRFVIHDCREIEVILVDEDAIEELAAIDHAAARSNPRFVVAFVAILPHVIALANRYISSGISMLPAKALPSLIEARRWIARSISNPGNARTQPGF